MPETWFGLSKLRLSRHRPSQLRVLRTSLYGLLILTFLFFSISLMSLVHQQESVQQLSLSNIRAEGARIAVEIEGKVATQAASRLSAERLKGIRYDPGDDRSPEKMKALRLALGDLEKPPSMARHFFILEGRKVVSPGLSLPDAEPLESLLSGESPRTARQFTNLLKDGDQEESETGGHLENALKLYRRAEALDVSDRLKALAAFRTARALEGAGRMAEAVPAYKRLIKLYGDQYDEYRTPYTIALLRAPLTIAGPVYVPHPQTLQGIYQDLMEGRRWELTADQVDIALGHLQRLGIQLEPRPSSNFLDRFTTARAAEAAFRVVPVLQSEGVNPLGFRHEGNSYQTFYSVLPGSNGQDVRIGFAVSAPWVQEKILPDSVAELAGGTAIKAVVQEAPPPRGWTLAVVDIYIPFRESLSTWSLRIPAESVQGHEAAANRELWFLATSSAMFLCVLGLSVYLLARVSRDLNWYQVRSDFVSGVSHELKTPLSLIRLYSETLADDDQGYPPEERHTYIRIIARESERLTRLIDNILDFSKIEQGRKRFQLQEGDLAATVKQTVDDYSEYLAQRGFTVKVSFQPLLPPARFDQEQVSQVVLNLLDNARKYSGKSRLIRVHMWWEQNRVALEVQDYGVGIPAKEREKIFEPFYRVPGAGEKGGCGLGLYLVRNVMDGHSGSIEVLSEVGIGSRFRLYFPVGATAPLSYREPETHERESSLIETG